MKLRPFWVEDHPRPQDLTTDLPSETDYLIIGSGFTGLSSALRLSESRGDVTLIDAGEIAGGASAINAGMVSPDVKAGVRAVHSSYGADIAGEMWASTVRSVELVRHLATRPGIDALVHDNGMAALGRGARQAAAFRDHANWYRDNLGIEFDILGPAQIGKVVGGDFFDVALYQSEAFGVHPARLAFGMTNEVNRSGALLVDHCEATNIEKTVNGFRVETARGSISAGNVIIATNGYTTAVPSKELSRLVLPIGSYIIVTEPIGAVGAEEIFPGGAMTYTRRRLLNYMRRTHDDRILLGGRRSLHTDLDLTASAHDLRKALIKYWPQLDDVEVSYVWGGKLGITFDLIPHIGRVDGAWYALGYAGHGVGLACQLGFELAGMLLGEDPPSVYSRIPHRGRFYYSGRSTWFLTPASHLYRALDWVGV